jgi:hypothetical protein
VTHTRVVLVTGGRDFCDEKFIGETLDYWQLKYGIYVLIHGGATGVDSIAGRWAVSRGVIEAVCRPNYLYHDQRRAPLIRNERMAMMKPDACLAFPGGSGTGHMIAASRNVGIPVFTFDPGNESA